MTQECPVATLVPIAVLQHWERFLDSQATPLAGGLINLTLALRLTDGARVVLQRLHPVFSAAINTDIAAVTKYLAAHGVLTPQLVPTDTGALWVTHDGIWRALTFLPGQAPSYLSDARMAHAAGQLVGTFHAALADFDYHYQSGRGLAHDTTAHLIGLVASLESHPQHRLYDAVAQLSAPLLRAAENLDLDLRHLPLRHAHGDLKISNLLFDRAGQGLAVLDLDTLGYLPWPLEMGDALRSWCHPRREDEQPARLQLDLLEGALRGYYHTTGALITPAEWQALLPGLVRICLELSARFLRDALEETYFGWDNTRYPARGEHHLARGQAMWLLYQDVQNQRRQAEVLITRLIN